MNEASKVPAVLLGSVWHHMVVSMLSSNCLAGVLDMVEPPNFCSMGLITDIIAASKYLHQILPYYISATDENFDQRLFFYLYHSGFPLLSISKILLVKVSGYNTDDHIEMGQEWMLWRSQR